MEFGHFLPSINTSISNINALDVNPRHQLYAFGGENGLVELWDPRNNKNVASLSSDENSSVDITALSFSNNGLEFSVANADGNVSIYDLRSSIPTITKLHPYGYSIKSLFWLDYEINGNLKNKIVSMDKKMLKIWDSRTVDKNWF